MQFPAKIEIMVSENNKTIIKIDNFIMLFSYKTLVAFKYTTGEKFVTTKCDHSNTTKKHVKDFFGYDSFKDVKKMVAERSIKVYEN